MLPINMAFLFLANIPAPLIMNTINTTPPLKPLIIENRTLLIGAIELIQRNPGENDLSDSTMQAAIIEGQRTNESTYDHNCSQKLL